MRREILMVIAIAAAAWFTAVGVIVFLSSAFEMARLIMRAVAS